MLAVMVGLGVWQLQRLVWKRALLAEIEQGEALSPTPLGDIPVPFRRVVVQGRFIPVQARYGAEVRTIEAGPVMGAHVIGAIMRQAGLPILIDRGWAPLAYEDAAPSGLVRVEGYVRPPEPAMSWLGVKDDPLHRRFFSLDPAVIGLSLGLQNAAPFTIVELGPAAGFPMPSTNLPRPPNDHLSYAVTWFGLAFSLLVVFGIYARQSARKDGRL